MSLNSGAAAVAGGRAASEAHGGASRAAPAPSAVASVCSLERARVAAERDLEALLGVEHQSPARASGDDDAHRPAQREAVRAQAAGDALAADRDEQHRHRRPERVDDREQHGLEADLVLRREHRDRREHRPGARHEDEPEARAEQEAAAEVAAPAPREACERPLEQEAEAGEDQRRRDQEEHRDREVPQDVLRQAEQVEEPGGRECEDREAEDEAGDDRVGPRRVRPSRRPRAGSAAPAARTARAR